MSGASKSPFYLTDRSEEFDYFRMYVDKVFSESFSPFHLTNSDSGTFQFSPGVDIFELGDRVLLSIDLPGMHPEDIDVSLHGHYITVAGERKVTSEQAAGESFRTERLFGAFRRTVSLPFPVSHDNVRAVYDMGVLNISVHKPHADTEVVQKIEVHRVTEVA